MSFGETLEKNQVSTLIQLKLAIDVALLENAKESQLPLNLITLLLDFYNDDPFNPAQLLKTEI